MKLVYQKGNGKKGKMKITFNQLDLYLGPIRKLQLLPLSTNHSEASHALSYHSGKSANRIFMKKLSHKLYTNVMIIYAVCHITTSGMSTC
jgi:hypothetical protein